MHLYRCCPCRPSRRSCSPKGLLYINDSGGTIGGTIVSSTLYGFELDVEDTGFIPKWSPNGQLYFDSHKQKAVEALLLRSHSSTTHPPPLRLTNGKRARVAWCA
jgi:hypothetical protein